MADPGAWARWKRAAADALRALPHRDRGERMILAGLSAALERTGAPEPFDLRTGRLVIFSDHHRGGRDGADDFLRCERAYRAALGHYLELGHELALLGDVDELWENRLPKPIDCYPEVLALERAFHAGGRLRRFWGNHDLVWSRPDVVEDHLQRAMGTTPLRVQESVVLEVRDGARTVGRLFLAHGHQGTPESDLFAPLAKLPVRYVWPVLQRGVAFASTTPAEDFALRAVHDQRMFRWACREAEADRRAGRPPLVLVTGHTHKPVFYLRKGEFGGPPRPAPEEARAAYEAAVAAGAPPEERAPLRAMWELVTTKDPAPPSVDLDPPCYFNTGCCSFGDGDVTGLEIADGRIRLVRWLHDDGQPRPQVLADKELAELFAEVAAG